MPRENREICSGLQLCAFAGTLLCLLSLPAHGQNAPRDVPANHQEAGEDHDPAVVLELGAATNWNFSGGAATFAPNLGAEITPIENWLEIEASVSPFYTRNSTEWDTDLTFKKPWTLSRKVEFMPGVGPEWVHLRQNGKTSDSITGQVVADFFFWPTGRHRFGWFLEPVLQEVTNNL